MSDLCRAVPRLNVAVLSGGVGGARFLRGLVDLFKTGLSSTQATFPS